MIVAVLATIAAASSAQCLFEPNGSETETGSVSVNVFWTIEPIGCELTPALSDWAAHTHGRSDAAMVHSEQACNDTYNYSNSAWWDAGAEPPNTSIGGAYASTTSLQGEASAYAWYDGMAGCSVNSDFSDEYTSVNFRSYGRVGYEVTPIATDWEVRVHFYVQYDFDTINYKQQPCGNLPYCSITYPSVHSSHPGAINLDSILGVSADFVSCCDHPYTETDFGWVTLSDGEVSAAGYFVDADTTVLDDDSGCTTPPTGLRLLSKGEWTNGAQYYSKTMTVEYPKFIRAFWKLNPQGEGSLWNEIPLPWMCEGCECGCILDPNGDNAADGFDVEAIEKCVGGDFSETRCCDLNGDFSTDGFDVEEMERRVGTGSCD